ncbi:MAG TPA: succinylglutamate desuccinylase/aspartoacylase family protein [Chloroflexota bacterium]|nr:succinylglutamate desuccinylase/aspartoacylase family protein [Chloroflexota bacterium]
MSRSTDTSPLFQASPGSRRETTLAVQGGANAEALEIPLLIARGQQDGPVVAVLGGVHGDEYEGTVAAGMIWQQLDVEALCGTVIVVPTANPPACTAGSRTSPTDGLNLARTFPGSPTGTISQRIAHGLSEAIIGRVDFLIDLHSAGQHYAMPLLCGSYAGDNALGRRCLAAAAAFGAPILWEHPTVAPGRTLSVALEAGIPCLYVECSGGGRIRSDEVEAYVEGVRRVLAHLGAFPQPAPPASPQLRLRDTGNTDEALQVTCAGFLVSRVPLLARVECGQALGEVFDARGAVLETLRAPHDGIVVLARRTARVHPGDGAYLLATEAHDTAQ